LLLACTEGPIGISIVAIMVTQYDHSFNLLLLGSSEVGKTALLKRFVQNTYRQTDITIGIDQIKKVIELDSKILELHVYDSPGAEKLMRVPPRFIEIMQGIFVVYDVTDRDSFMKASRYIPLIRLNAQQDVPLMVLGCKSDRKTQRAVSFEEGMAFANDLKASFMEVSAKTSANVGAAFIAMVANVKARIEANVLSY
jgi:small GTP-binding protein